jgi:hypothetical protein
VKGIVSWLKLRSTDGYQNRGLVSGTGLAGAFRLKRRDRCPVRILWVYHARHGLLRTGIRAFELPTLGRLDARADKYGAS